MPVSFYKKKIGNLRDHDFNFLKLWKSEENKKVKKYIKKQIAIVLMNVLLRLIFWEITDTN